LPDSTFSQITGDVLNEDVNPEWDVSAQSLRAEAKLRVTRKRSSDVPISRFIFGNFIESGFGRQTSGMWAEMLYNRSFQDIPPATEPTWGWLQLDAEHYNEDAPFWHSGYEENDWELIAPEHSERRRTHGSNTFKGHSSLGVSNTAPGAWAGVRQRGVYLEAGREYQLAVFGGLVSGWGEKVSPPLEGFPPVDQAALATKPVRVVLREEGSQQRELFSYVLDFGCLQKRFDLIVVNPDFTGRAVLEIAFDWEGAIVLSWCSMMPADNVRGWRADVVKLLKDVSPPVIRFPGGCFASFADWRDAVGPRAARGANESYYWGGLDENDVGIDEYLDLCTEIGAQPQVCINMMTSTPHRAAELVEYCNGLDDSCMGRFRQENGVTRRGRVLYWEMDNEPARKWSALQYAEKVVEFAEAMRQVDPDIRIMMAYYGYRPSLYWLPQMLEIAGGHVDYIIHREKSTEFITEALAIVREYNRSHDTDIRQVNTEWLPSANSPEPFADPEIPQNYAWGQRIINDYKRVFSFRQCRWFYALNAACTLLDYISLGGEFHLANFNNCVNTWGQNIIDAAKEGAWLSAAGHVFKFFRAFEGEYPLQTAFDAGETPFVKAQACEVGERRIDVYVVNVGRDAATVTLSLPKGFEPTSVDTIFAPERLSRCRLNECAVTVETRVLDAASTVEVRPLSVNQVVCRRRE